MPDITAVTHAQNIRYDRKAEALYIIDQTLLPGEEKEIRLQTIDEMVEAIYRDMPKEVTRVIAVGGGGVLDIAKLLVLQHVTPILDLYDGKLPLQKARDLVLVPTTCGTGSEVTNISILALLSRRTKKCSLIRRSSSPSC